MNQFEILRTSDKDLLMKTLRQMTDNLSMDNVVQNGDILHLKTVYDHESGEELSYQLLAELNIKDNDKKRVRCSNIERVGSRKKRRTKIKNIQRTIETLGVEVMVLINVEPFKTYDHQINTTWAVFDSYCPLMWQGNKPVLDTQDIPLTRTQLELYSATSFALRVNGEMYALSKHGLLSLARKIDAITAFPEDATTDELIAQGFMLATKLTKLGSNSWITLLTTKVSATEKIIQGVADARYQIIRQYELVEAIVARAQAEFNVIPRVLGAEVSVNSTLIDLELETMNADDVKMGIRIQNSDLGDQALTVTLFADINGAMGYLATNRQLHVKALDDSMIDHLFTGFKELYDSFNKTTVGMPLLSKAQHKEFTEILGKKRMNQIQLQVGQNNDFYSKISKVSVSSGKWQWRLHNAIGQVILEGQKVLERSAV